MAQSELIDKVYNRFIPSISAPTVNVEVVNTGTKEYKYKVTAVNETGETNAEFIIVSNGPSILSSLNYIRLFWQKVDLARAYRIYGRTSDSFGFLKEVTDLEYIDYGIDLVVSDNLPPIDNNTGRLNWDSVAFIPGRGLQSAELNEVQSIQDEYLKRVGDSLFKEGDIISGCTLGIEGNVAKITEGYVYIRGKVRYIKPASVTITKIGVELLGIEVTEEFEDDTDDEFLKDPAQAFPGYATSGALRKIINLEWKKSLETDETSSILVYKLVDGEIFLYKAGPYYSQLEKMFARKIDDISGHTLIKGFKGYVIPHRTRRDKATFIIEPGKGYISGYEVDKPLTTRLDVDIAKEYAVSTNVVIDDPAGYTFTPDVTPIHSVTSCSICVLAENVQRTVPTSTGGGCATNWFKDELPQAEIVSIRKIVYNSVTVPSSKYALSGRNVCLDNTYFSSGQSYFIDYVYLQTANKSSLRKDSHSENHTFLTATKFYTLGKKRIVLNSKFPVSITVNDVVFTGMMLIKDIDNNVYEYGSDFLIETSANYKLVEEFPRLYFVGRTPVNNKSITIYYNYWNILSQGDYASCDCYLEPSDPYQNYSYDAISDANVIDFQFGTNKPTNIKQDFHETVTTTYNLHTYTALTFTATGSYDISYIELKLRKDATVSDLSTLNVQLWSNNTSTNKPDNLLYSVKTNLKAIFIETTETTFECCLKAPVVQGEKYWIVLELNKLGTGHVKINSNTPTATGQIATSSDGIIWTLVNNVRFYFRTYSNLGIRTTYNYFLSNQGWLCLDKDANFNLVTGVADLNPKLISKPFGQLPRYRVYMDAFSQNLKLIEDTNYEVLKQHDLNLMQNRIENNEYNIALTNLELELLSKHTSTYKKALFTDPFVDSSRVQFIDNLGMDTEKGHLILKSNVYQVNTLLDLNNSTVNISNNLITLPYTDTVHLSQLIWTEGFAQSVNPFSSFGPISKIKLYPEADFYVYEIKSEDIKIIYQDIAGISTILQGLRVVLQTLTSQAEIDAYVLNAIADKLKIDVNKLAIVKREFFVNFSLNFLIPTQVVYTRETTNFVLNEQNVKFLPFMRVIDILIYGQGCPPNEGNIGCLFGDVSVPLLIATTQDIQKKQLSFSPMGSQHGSTKIRANSNGQFLGKITIPQNTKCGEYDIVVSSDSGLVNGTADFHGIAMAHELKTIKEIIRQRQLISITYYSPLAETFIVDNNMFVTSIDVWFYRVPLTNNEGIKVALRSTDNGYPSKVIYGESFLSKSQIIAQMANNNQVEINNITTKGVLSNATPSLTNGRVRFTFPHPILLEGKQEYCFTIEDSAPGYYVYVSQLGKKILGDLSGKATVGRVLDFQPHNGNLFISANNIAWEIAQDKDLMFRINKAQFTTNQVRYLYFNDYSSPETVATGNITNASPIITNINVLGLEVGFSIIGNGIPSNSFIIAIGTDTVTMNNNATQTLTNVSLTFRRLFSKFSKTMATENFIESSLVNEYSIDGGTTWKEYSYQDFDGDKTNVKDFTDLATMTNRIKFRAGLQTTKADVSPIIYRNLLDEVQLFYYSDTGIYETTNQIYKQGFDNLLIWVDEANAVSLFGSSVYDVSFDNGLTWYPSAGFTKTNYIDLDYYFKEYTFGGTLLSITANALSTAYQFKIRIRYSHNKESRFYTPIFRRLRAVVY